MSATVSIVTPSYNQAQFLAETIQSVLHQDYAPLEYIIIDGGSSDDSVNIIRRYASRLAYWVSERDAGQADAINKGWQKITGDIVAYLNSDDVYMPGVVRQVVEFFDAHPDVDVVYGDRIVIDAQSRVQEIVPSREFSLDTQIAESLPQECVFFRRRALDAVGLLNPELHYLMDYDLWLRMLRAGMKFQHVPQAWAKYRIHTTSKYSNQRVFFWREMLDVIEAYLKSDPRVPYHLAAATRAHLYFQAGLEVACGGAREEGARYIHESFTYNTLPFGDIETLAARAANIIVNALLLARSSESPEKLFVWLLEQIPPVPARAQIWRAIESVRERALGEYYLAKAFDDYAHGDYAHVARHVVAGARRIPAALANRGVWSITAKSLMKPSAQR